MSFSKNHRLTPFLSNVEVTKFFRMSIKKPLWVILLLLLFLGLTMLNGRLSLLSLIIAVWCICWLAVILSWGILLGNDGVSSGYKVLWVPFFVRRSLLFSDVRSVCRNGLGDVVLFSRSDLIRN